MPDPNNPHTPENLPSPMPNPAIVWLAGPRGRARHRVWISSANSRTSYLTYAMSTIMDRALPDVRDGLKPSQRRLLVAMNDLNLRPAASTSSAPRSSATTMGNYHPHGDAALYGTLVGMAQPWRIPRGPGRAAGQLRLHRGGPARIDAVHRGPHGPRRGGHAHGPQAGHGGTISPTTTTVSTRAGGAAFSLPQPPGERGASHRRGAWQQVDARLVDERIERFSDRDPSPTPSHSLAMKTADDHSADDHSCTPTARTISPERAPSLDRILISMIGH